MAIKGLDFKWYDGFFLSMLATSIIIIALNWKHYDTCKHPLHIWIVVDYGTVFVFRLLMFVDNGLAAGMGLDFGPQQRYTRFCGRVVVLFILCVLLYPFLWAWTVIGSLWFTTSSDCLPEDGQKWGFLIWLLFSYSGLFSLAAISMKTWLRRRQAHSLQAQQGIPISEFGVLVDMISVPDWALENAAGQEMRVMGQDAGSYHPGLYLTQAECPICLEEFHVGNEVRGLPCAHNFHVGCIDEWLRLNVKCPRCRSSVFPNLDLSAVFAIPADPHGSTVATARYLRSQPSSQSFMLRMQGFLRPIYTETEDSRSVNTLETADNGGLPANHPQSDI
nr:E3 ubiquitin-protein ligase SIS3-like [Tanacetum cinerariifolium]